MSGLRLLQAFMLPTRCCAVASPRGQALHRRMSVRRFERRRMELGQKDS